MPISVSPLVVMLTEEPVQDGEGVIVSVGMDGQLPQPPGPSSATAREAEQLVEVLVTVTK